MNAILNPQDIFPEDDHLVSGEAIPALSWRETHSTHDNICPLQPNVALLFSKEIISHHPQAGINPLVDAADRLFSVIGTLQFTENHLPLNYLQTVLIEEIQGFHKRVKQYTDNLEIIDICKYLLCTLIDETIQQLKCAQPQPRSESYLLNIFYPGETHTQKYHTLLEKIIKSSPTEIELMEFLYICLQVGRKGKNHITNLQPEQIGQIIACLYQQIHTYRNCSGKNITISNTSNVVTKKIKPHKKTSLFFILFATLSMILTLFITLSYLTDLIANDIDKSIAQFEKNTSKFVSP
jgi:type VI secretion system protein ImpK